MRLQLQGFDTSFSGIFATIIMVLTIPSFCFLWYCHTRFLVQKIPMYQNNGIGVLACTKKMVLTIPKNQYNCTKKLVRSVPKNWYFVYQFFGIFVSGILLV